MQSSEKKSGKKVFVLESFIRKNGQDIKDGYLLFPNPEKAANIIEVCEQALKDERFRPFSENGQAFYKPKDWIVATDFYGNQVQQRGSMFVRKLEDAILDLSVAEIAVWENETEQEQEQEVVQEEEDNK